MPTVAVVIHAIRCSQDRPFSAKWEGYFHLPRANRTIMNSVNVIRQEKALNLESSSLSTPTRTPQFFYRVPASGWSARSKRNPVFNKSLSNLADAIERGGVAPFPPFVRLLPVSAG